MQLVPAAPQRLPTRQAIALATLVPSQPPQRLVNLLPDTVGVAVELTGDHHRVQDLLPLDQVCRHLEGVEETRNISALKAGWATQTMTAPSIAR